MIFGCPKCNADCPIPDERIKNRILKVRCRKCEHIFFIKDPALEGKPSRAMVPPAPEADEIWFYAINQQTHGPVSVGVMRHLIESALVLANTLVWKEGLPQWKVLADVPELTSILQEIAHPKVATDAPVAPGLEGLDGLKAEDALEFLDSEDLSIDLDQAPAQDVQTLTAEKKRLLEEAEPPAEPNKEEQDLIRILMEEEERLQAERTAKIKELRKKSAQTGMELKEEEEEELPKAAETEKTAAPFPAAGKLKSEALADLAPAEEPASVTPAAAAKTPVNATEAAPAKTPTDLKPDVKQEVKPEPKPQAKPEAPPEAKPETKMVVPRSLTGDMPKPRPTAADLRVAERKRGLQRRTIDLPVYHPTEEAGRPEEKAKTEAPRQTTPEAKEPKPEPKIAVKPEAPPRDVKPAARPDIKLVPKPEVKPTPKPVTRSELRPEAPKAALETTKADAQTAPARRSMTLSMPAQAPTQPVKIELPQTKPAIKTKSLVQIVVAVLLVGAAVLGIYLWEINRDPAEFTARLDSEPAKNLFLAGEVAGGPAPAKADPATEEKAVDPAVVVEAKPKVVSEPGKPSDRAAVKEEKPAARNSNGADKVQAAKPEEKKKEEPAFASASLAMPAVPSENSVNPLAPNSLKQEQITAVINRNIGRIKFCYDSQLRRNPGLTGKVIMNFVIQPDGSVNSVMAKTAKFKGSYLEQCVRESMMTWRFPRFNGDAIDVDYPFVFSAF